jgi:hypothetical protein
MIASSSHVRRFNLLYLEEGEHYIKEFHAELRHFDLGQQAMKKAEAKLHFCSRSLIIEPILNVSGAEHSMSLFKYLYRNFVKEPTFNGKCSKQQHQLILTVINSLYSNGEGLSCQLSSDQANRDPVPRRTETLQDASVRKR